MLIGGDTIEVIEHERAMKVLVNIYSQSILRYVILSSVKNKP
jgi:hypothetical protein